MGAKDRIRWINARSYQIWEQSGRPDGLQDEHWYQASAEWDEAHAAEYRAWSAGCDQQHGSARES
ncbi:DUF2934 domain-containing protein [Neorhizobium alkalisoli]|uniref:DUF2934 family protein n=1 Tax=Neorhizobium alkalisoli TaxID=528178 RepID=A0A561QAY8_9HYPH|nr:DUF2934 domain-containing protein [Neorhizobium alkalisoli]TWF47529.1 DUF2934 family protein [Neorhizobium alkalisoli]